MSKITKIDRQNLRVINTRVLDALKVLGDELGITFTTEKGRFSDGPRGSVTLTFACADESGEAQTADAVQFKRMAHGFGLKPEDYLARFKYKGDVYEIIGVRPRAPSYPIKTRQVYGEKKMVYFPQDAVVGLLAQARALKAA